ASRIGSKSSFGMPKASLTARSDSSWKTASSGGSAVVYSASRRTVGSMGEWIFAMHPSTTPDRPYDRQMLDPADPRRQWLEDYVKNSLMPHRIECDSSEVCEAAEIQIVRISEVINETANAGYQAVLRDMQQGLRCDCRRVQELSRAIPVCSDYEGPKMNEVLLFHGCSWSQLFGVLREGFDSRLGGNQDASFGIGSYFTAVASKADGYSQRWGDWEERPACDISPDIRCLLVARVALGEISEQLDADTTLRRPPMGRGDRRCDSVLGVPRDRGGCVDYDEFVVYRPGQATPQFIIDYQHLPSCFCRCCIRERDRMGGMVEP
ncbi:unnamed protein product, partial [Polarella glacialis]